jgi:hypothetical protein
MLSTVAICDNTTGRWSVLVASCNPPAFDGGGPDGGGPDAAVDAPSE